MRTISGRRNRAALLVGGTLMLLAAAWVGSASTPLRERWLGAEPYLPQGASTVADIATAHSTWLLPTALAVSVVVAALGLLLLAAQIPTRPPRGDLRITDQDDQLLGSLAPGVLERAMSEAVEGISGVSGAEVLLGGSTARPWAHVTLSLAEDAEVAALAAIVRRRVADDVTTVLAAPPSRVDLRVTLHSARTPRLSRPASAALEAAGAETGGASAGHPRR